MNELDNIQARLAGLYQALEANDQAIDELRMTLNNLKGEPVAESSCESTLLQKDAPTYWMDYIFPPNSNLLRYKCSNCGYIATYKLLSCPKCKEYMGA